MRNPSYALPLSLLLAVAAVTAAQPHQVIPAAADTTSSSLSGKPVMVDFRQLGDCTADTGLSAKQEFCQTAATLTKPNQAHWYRFNVLEADSAFTLHFLIRVQNGRVRMGLWLPGQNVDEQPSVTSEILLGSSFAQEQYITVPAAQLFQNPGIYQLQILNEYGAPHYELRADLTPATTLLAEEDRAAAGQIVQDCCSSVNGLVCYRLSEGVSAESIEQDLCHSGPIQCDAAGHITDLVLQGTDGPQDLTCPHFSTGFAQLPSLRRLDLAGANLGADLATIAQALAPATNLQWLVLRTAHIVGELSCDILLPSLQLLSLTRNSLKGDIPDCFTKSTTLKHLYLSDNSLSGSLPEFSPDSSLELLFVRDQQADGQPTMTGGLPASLATAGNLLYLQLSNNDLTGKIGELPANLRYFNVSSNSFEGSFPTLPASLVSLDLSGNMLSGSLPSDMSNDKNLVDIQIYLNDLEGALPARLPPRLIQLTAAGNKLSGTVPPLPRGMKYLSLAENQLEGGLPDGPGASSLWFGDFSSNKFSGAIPTSFTQSEELVYLNVSRNQLTSIEAVDGWNTPTAITLDASFNAIQGTIPAALAEQPNLAYINFGSNKLTGNLDAFAAAVQPDTSVGGVFDISSNQLTGSLPEGLGNLAVFSPAPTAFPSWNELDTTGYPVKVFNAADNNFKGPFPSYLISSLTGSMAHNCAADPNSCNLWIDIDGGNNEFTCPGRQSVSHGITQHDYSLLRSQNLGCQGQNGVTYEVSSILQGHPAALQKSAKPPRPTAQPAPPVDPSLLPAQGQPQTEAPQATAEAPEHAAQPARLPVAVIAGIVGGAIGVAVLVAVIGYVVVYRRWYTVTAAQGFKKMQEGPLAAAGGAIVNSSAPAAGASHLTAPSPADTAHTVLGGDDRV